MAASAFLQKTGAVAADFSGVVDDDVVGSVVSDDVVGADSEEFDAAAFDEFTCFFVHEFVAGHAVHLPYTG